MYSLGRYSDPDVAVPTAAHRNGSTGVRLVVRLHPVCQAGPASSGTGMRARGRKGALAEYLAAGRQVPSPRRVARQHCTAAISSAFVRRLSN